ncbi:hypothetical protein NW756_010163 [Fusarium oxysporum]|nr:hypothetical protein NW763_003691 [Fusarium oxysporum]WKT46972.1 hypothetical protein QSH57_011877 [Fusarium oxysporum f. sp. vasinfectum]KAJ4067809.1 hypothetical protein NW753_002871 [Fusarium oxysporum]KAJ4082474.1 hypothetical protein NW756_010163 [Fusarium oxysporum]KAJ4108639.1 hypothetical protein NW769_008567 [Fusarium oxysporum]
MNTHSPSKEDEPTSETGIQQTILVQAQAAAAAQVIAVSTKPGRHKALLDETDLVTSDPNEDDVPPPAYGDAYGEICNAKDGLGTSASVTEDGRVNIRINQLNRRLSQVFSPALHQQAQSVQETRPPPISYISSDLGGDGISKPPQLNVVIQVVGSRGDVQPFVALGKVLKDTYGHRVRLATHPNFKNFVLENGLEFFSIGGDPSQLMSFMVKNPGLMPGFGSLLKGDVGQRRRDVTEYIQGCWRSCYKAGDGMSHDATGDGTSEPAASPFIADCIIANPPSFAHIHCAERLGIPLHIMFTMPYSPTQAFPHPLANIQSSNTDPQLTNYISYAMIELLAWQGLSDIINRFRAKCLGLDPVSVIWAPGMLQRLKIPHTYCWSPALIPKPKDWGSQISISGFYFLNLASNYTPSLDLQAFLDAGPPPVYIGFGSIVLRDPNAMTDLIFEAVRKTGQRVLLSKGWGGMGADELRIPDGVFMLGNVPHDWLFKHVSCVVHHGGAGTTAAGIKAGRPTVVVPFFGDQPFWGAMVSQAGAGPDPIPHKQLTADRLADAINFCLKSESLERAKELASKIIAERGCDIGAQSLHQHLEVNRLRCALAPSRVATWRIKHTQVRLSAFAAWTLANANLLDFHDLKLFRSREYVTDEGPWDPISGGFTAICRALGNMAMGVADFPSETFKALPIPSTSSRKQSQVSLSTTSSKEQKRTGLNSQESLATVQSLPNLSGKDYDMLRQTRAHTSKGFGRIVKAALESPAEISVSFTRGFHNVPKLWGDETVRPQEKVTDLKSGFKAIGKEFGFGWYDGVTGLFTQPWKGAQKDGAGGFFKGIGKGVGGFLIKPNAALWSIPAYFMKGVNKEVQKLFGSTVQNYIVASRVTQGYEEWLQSSDAEKEDVIVRWKLIQKYLKKKAAPEDMIRDVLEAHRERDTEKGEAHQEGGDTASPPQPTDAMKPQAQYAEDAVPTLGNNSQSSFPLDGSLGMAGTSDTTQRSTQDMLRSGTEEDAHLEKATQQNELRIQIQRQEVAGHQKYQDDLREAMASSETEAQRHASEALEYEKLLKSVMTQSVREQRQSENASERESQIDLRGKKQIGCERVTENTDKRTEQVYDQGHPQSTTQRAFVKQQQRQEGEKTTEEKTEEEFVMEYIKKASLLEIYRQEERQGCATGTVE